MLRSAAVTLLVVLLCACTSVTPAATPTPGPTITPAPATPTPSTTLLPTTAPTPTTVATPTASPAATAAATATVPPSGGPAAEVCGTDWFTSPAECAGAIGDRFSFQCPPAGRSTAIYGTDTYTDDSSACVAAVHAGLIGFSAGGAVTIELTAGLASYTGSSRNGVESSDWNSWPTSFVFVGGAVDPLAALIAHIPDPMQGDCGEVISFDDGALVSVQCINIPSVDGYATYTQFDTLDNLNISYQSDVDYFGATDNAGNCQTGPSEGGYTIGGAAAGRVVCNTYTGIDPNGLILYWTNEGLLIIGSLAMYGGTFQDMYDIWAGAGPIP